LRIDHGYSPADILSLGIVLTVPLAMLTAVRLIPKKAGDRR